MRSETQFQLAFDLHLAGKLDDAEKAYRGLLESDPSHAHVKLNLATLLFDRVRIDEARELCLAFLESGIEDPAAELLMSRISCLDGDPEAGFSRVKTARRLAPEDAGVAFEFATAARQRYWTYRPDEYQEDFLRAQKGELLVERLQRLCHQTFAKMVRPRLIELITEPQADDAIPVIEVWKKELEKQAIDDLDVIARNFQAALVAVHTQGRYLPRKARLVLRDDSEVEAPTFVDACPMTLGTLELIDEEGGVTFLPLGTVDKLSLGDLGAAVQAEIVLSGGEELTGIMPLFYLFTEFSRDDEIREGRSTHFPELMADIRVPIGMREWYAGEMLTPMANVVRIEFLG